jgi:hypothetical protein
MSGQEKRKICSIPKEWKKEVVEIIKVNESLDMNLLIVKC